MHFSCMSTCRGVMSTSHFSLENANRHVDISHLKWDVDISVKTAIPYINFLNVLHYAFYFWNFLGQKSLRCSQIEANFEICSLALTPAKFMMTKRLFRNFGRFDLTPNIFSRAWEWWHLATSRSYEMSTCDISLGRLKSTCQHLRCQHLARCQTSQMSCQALEFYKKLHDSFC